MSINKSNGRDRLADEHSMRKDRNLGVSRTNDLTICWCAAYTSFAMDEKYPYKGVKWMVGYTDKGNGLVNKCRWRTDLEVITDALLIKPAKH